MFIVSFALLIVFLLVLQQEALAPWAATASLLVINQFRQGRMAWLRIGGPGLLPSVSYSSSCRQFCWRLASLSGLCRSRDCPARS